MEKALLAGVCLPGQKLRDINDSLDELSRLAETAGTRVEKRIVQNRASIDSACFIGRGKAAEIAALARELGIVSIIFDDELKPVQQKNLEEITGLKIIDRTRLILDIFARRARSKEGILQVERAQLEYYLPRLSKRGLSLDSQAGGIGTRRGPGEKKLEIDQRKIRDRMAFLDREIELISEHRKVLRQKRAQNSQALISIVGYTNAGKSTLLNLLCERGEIYADDKLFATLDPTTRQVKLENGRTVLFTDTVGFINKLPHMLVASFKATLEEISGANCLIHLIDASNPACSAQEETVINVLKELGAQNIPMITVFNKADLLAKNRLERLRGNKAIAISAKTGEGVGALLKAVEKIVTPKLFAHTLSLDHSESALVNKIHSISVVKKQEYDKNRIRLKIECSSEQWSIIQSILG